MSTLADLGATLADIETRQFSTINRTFYVDSFYDGTRATGPANEEVTLADLGYGSLGAAQVDYPVALSLNDQVDWCVWQMAADAVYNQGALSDVNLMSGRIVPSASAYKVNRTITCNNAMTQIVGAGCSMTNAFESGETSIQLVGAGGSDGESQYIFDFYVFDEFGLPAPGRLTGPGMAFEVTGVKFMGNLANISGNSASLAEYKSAIRCRQSGLARVNTCFFGGTLYDGFISTAPQLFLVLDFNTFDGVHRDAIANWNCSPTQGGFSTTEWIHDNRFRNCGRYAIYLDYEGGVEPFPIVFDNNVESAFATSYFTLHPEWYLHGVPAPVCIRNGTLMRYSGNHHKSAGYVDGIWADLHLAETGFATIEHSDMRAMAITIGSIGQNRTSDAIDYMKPYGSHQYLDLTNTRNYRMATALDFSGQIDSLTLRDLPNCDIFYGDTYDIMSAGVVHDYSQINPNLWIVPAQAGSETTAVTPDVWTPTTQVYRRFSPGLPTVVRPTIDNGYFFQCQNADGITGSSEPSWNTAVPFSSTTVDGSVTWLCINKAGQTTSRSVFGTRATATVAWSRGLIGALSLHSVRLGSQYYNTYSGSSAVGSWKALDATGLGYSTWTALTVYQNTLPTNQSVARIIVVPITFNGYIFQCTTAGTSGSSEPSWNANIGATTTDGSVVWTCVDFIWHSDDANRAMFYEITGAQRQGTAAPTHGRFNVSDKVWFNAPSAGDYLGLVCTAPGLSPTWKKQIDVAA